MYQIYLIFLIYQIYLIYLSTYEPTYLPTYLSIYLSISLSLCLSDSLRYCTFKNWSKTLDCFCSLTSKCACVLGVLPLLQLASSKTGPSMNCFDTFDFQMRLPPKSGFAFVLGVVGIDDWSASSIARLVSL